MRRARPERPILAAALAIVVLLAIPAATLAAPSGWQVTLTPPSINAGQSTEVQVTVTLQGILPTDLIGCVTVGVDPVFSVSGSRIISTPWGKSWLYVAPVTSGIVKFAARGGGDRLAGNLLGYESVTTGITVDGEVTGAYTWVIAAYANKSCTSKLSEQTITVSIIGGSPPTPTPAPTPGPTPAPTPASTVGPTPRPTPAPTPTNTPDTSAFPPPGGSTSPSPGSSPDPASPEPTLSSDPGSTLIPAFGIETPGASGPPGPGPVPAALVFQVPTNPDGTVDVAGMQLAAAVIGSLGVFRWAVPGALLSVPGLLIVLLTIVAQASGGLLWLPVVRRKLGAQRAKTRSTTTRQV